MCSPSVSRNATLGGSIGVSIGLQLSADVNGKLVNFITQQLDVGRDLLRRLQMRMEVGVAAHDLFQLPFHRLHLALEYVVLLLGVLLFLLGGYGPCQQSSHFGLGFDGVAGQFLFLAAKDAASAGIPTCLGGCNR